MNNVEIVGRTKGNPIQPPTEVRRFHLANDLLEVQLLTLGASIHDLAHKGTSVALGLDSVAAREDPARNPYLGVTVGRYTNRLANARFLLDGAEHRLAANEGPNQLHGGPVGFSRVVWDAESDGGEVCFRRRSPDGEMGFPGTVDAEVRYRLDGPVLHIVHTATTDADTIVSMTNHTYWNLGGPPEHDVLDHDVTVDAEYVVPVDDALLPAGPPVPVAGGPFDLRGPVRLRARLETALPNGFDHCFLPVGTGLRRHGRLDHGGTGRSLEVWSDQPSVQLYSAGSLDAGVGAHGRRHHRFAAVCIEPQHVPDAPNLDWAPSPVLRSGERYVHRLELRFSS